ncbi:MAG: glycosyltransferase, partial [Alcaligenaceae bacterium]
MHTTQQHVFVVPAYGRSAHLRSCLASLRQQTRPSPVIICTSTPHEGLERLAEEFDARLVVHSPNAGIGHDWNIALFSANAQWATLAHQDDIYLPHFAEDTLALLAVNPDASLVMTGYGELAGEQVRALTPMMAVKRLLQELAFLGRSAIRARDVKRRLLRFGCAIPCPSVTLRLAPKAMQFREDLRLNLDWDAWLRLADEPGAFVRVKRVSMLHRIHTGSETSIETRFTRTKAPGSSARRNQASQSRLSRRSSRNCMA